MYKLIDKLNELSHNDLKSNESFTEWKLYVYCFRRYYHTNNNNWNNNFILQINEQSTIHFHFMSVDYANYSFEVKSPTQISALDDPLTYRYQKRPIFCKLVIAHPSVSVK